MTKEHLSEYIMENKNMTKTIIPITMYSHDRNTSEVFTCDLCVFNDYFCEHIKCQDFEREDDTDVFFRLE